MLWFLLVLIPGAARAGVPADNRLDHWAWKLPVRSRPPAVRDRNWPANPIDAYLLAKMETAAVRPAARASREQLLRRVTFDVTGLPPTPEEIDRFVNDRHPNAYERVVDRLLASPSYGERWARHWLDVVRYADSNGFEFDEIRPNAWRYRDYVIRSFNEDKPYDRFIREQLAGDELFPDDSQALIATGFNLLGPDMTDSSDQKLRRQNTLNDMTDTTALAFLGLTMGCARCHDHKFEPITQRDYFSLQAFFTPAVFRHDLPISTAEERAGWSTSMKAFEELTRPLREEIAQLEEPYRKRIYDRKLAALAEEARAAHQTRAKERTPRQADLVAQTLRLLQIQPEEVVRALSVPDKSRHEAWQDRLKGLETQRPTSLPVAMGMSTPPGSPVSTRVLVRGELSSPGEEVSPGAPAAVSSSFQQTRADQQADGRRVALAEWIASPANPLTARVMMNRLWQHHFGTGLVATPNDFGVRGVRPSHAELLDWLATEFVAGGWRLKRMHKLMLMSAAYQQGLPARDQGLQHNATLPASVELFNGRRRTRLEAEELRDGILAVSGSLNLKRGGPGIMPPIPEEALEGYRGWKVDGDYREHRRRSIYVLHRRNLRFPFLEVFDLPDSNHSCPRREQTTTAPQALTLLNSTEVNEAAKAWAVRLQREAGPDGNDQVRLAYRLALGRPPSAQEVRLALDFLSRSPLSELCRALLNVNEFVYVE